MYGVEEIVAIKRKVIFKHDNVSAYAANLIVESLGELGFKNDRIIVWPPCFQDINPIENIWTTVKRCIYVGGKLFVSKNERWEARLAVYEVITPEEILKLTSVGSKSLQVIR